MFIFKRFARSLVLAITANMLIVFCSAAATFYVRGGASGANNGSDWTNAWSSMAGINYSAINAGDVIYIAGGTYGALNVIKSGAPSGPITFKRATRPEHGTTAGWADSYDAQVIIDGGGGLSAVGIGEGGSFAGQSHITIDGAVKNGIWLRNAMYGVRADRGNSNNLTFRYLDIGDPGAYKLGEDGIQGKGDNLLVEYSNIHDNDNIQTHGDGIQWFAGANMVIRYNTFKNNGQMFMLTETAWGSDYVNDASIYYNVFYNRGGSHYNGISKKLCPEPGRYWRVYNNTFDLEATSNSGYDNIFSGAGSCGQMEFRNNAVIHSNAGSVGNVTHSHNAFDNAGTYAVYNVPSETGLVVAADLGFVDAANANYRLTPSSALIGKGINVGLTKDFEGKPVPSTPSIGAFEPTTGASPTAPAPAPPAALVAPTNLVVR